MINDVTLIGNVGADPTIRCFENGNSVAKFRLVTTERYKDKEGNTRELNEWHTVEAWGKPAAIIDQYVRKGDRLYVKGSIHYEEYSDRDNIKRTQTIIRLQGVKLLSSKAKEQGEQSAPAATTPAPQTPPQVEQLQKELGLTPAPPQVPLPPMDGIDDLPF
jgi:single-strand DNA-binding protein